MKNFPIKPYHVIYILLRLGGFEAEKVEKVRGFEPHLTNFCPSYLYGSFPPTVPGNRVDLVSQALAPLLAAAGFSLPLIDHAHRFTQQFGPDLQWHSLTIDSLSEL